MSSPALMVLAAGMGSRYGGLKQVDAVGPEGETLLDYSIYDALSAGFGRVVFVIRREIEDVFREKVGTRFEGRTPVSYVFQENDDLPGGVGCPEGRSKPWGTGHAVLAGRSVIDGPFVVINADDFYGAEAFGCLAGFFQKGGIRENEFAMAGYRLGRTLSEHGPVARGVCSCDAEGWLERIVERTGIRRVDGEILCEDETGRRVPLREDDLVSLNFWGFTPAVFALLEEKFRSFLKECSDLEKAEFYLPAAVGEGIAAGRACVRVLPVEDSWLGVTYAADRDAVRDGIGRLVAQGRYPRPLWS